MHLEIFLYIFFLCIVFLGPSFLKKRYALKQSNIDSYCFKTNGSIIIFYFIIMIMAGVFFFWGVNSFESYFIKTIVLFSFFPIVMLSALIICRGNAFFIVAESYLQWNLTNNGNLINIIGKDMIESITLHKNKYIILKLKDKLGHEVKIKISDLEILNGFEILKNKLLGFNKESKTLKEENCYEKKS